MAAIRLANELHAENRPATPDEQEVLARWSSWGAIADVFDLTKPKWETERAELRALLTDAEWAAAERTTINAHYTDPAYASRMWTLLEALGFEGGTVLEPGAGAGTFIGLAPIGARIVGVELDPVTARIAAALYPHAEIRTESFADTRLGGLVDAVIGNVPFANVTLHDPVHNTGGHSMHNHFIVKSLALCRPGGVVAVLTSHYTLDAQNPAARREINQLADLVAAVRLPTGAHRRAAGTEAITDLLVLRRRADGQPPLDHGWETVTPTVIDGRRVKINTYYLHHPEHVLGTLTVGRGMYRDDSLLVTGDLDHLDTVFGETLDRIATTAHRQGLTFTPRTAEDHLAPTPEEVSPGGELWEGSIVVADDGSFHTVSAGGLEPLAVPRTARRELRDLVVLRDAATRLIELEAESREDAPDLEALRSRLRGLYESYQRRYGPLGRYQLRRTGRRNPAGDDIYARTVPMAVRLLRSEPFGPVVLALEEFNDQDQTATPAAILTRRVIAPTPPTMGVDTPADAVAVSLDRTGVIDLELIAHLLGTTPDDALDGLGTLVFTDPDTGRLVHAPEYLSGDVRSKLATATDKAASEPVSR